MLAAEELYPMFVPIYRGDARIQPPVSWGQDERNALGYRDYGTSEVFDPDEMQTGQQCGN